MMITVSIEMAFKTILPKSQNVFSDATLRDLVKLKIFVKLLEVKITFTVRKELRTPYPPPIQI